MPSESPLAALRFKLLRRGLPLNYVTRAVSELSDHWSDLKEELLAASASPSEAANAANQRLGSADQLADVICQRMRMTSWWGRHPGFSFGILPLLALMGWWFLLLLLGGWISGTLGDYETKSAGRVNWPLMVAWVQYTAFATGIVLPVLCCYLARRSFCGFRWAFIGCLVLALHDFFHFVDLIAPASGQLASLTWGYKVNSNLWQMNLSGLAIPLLVFAIFWLVARRRSTTAING